MTHGLSQDVWKIITILPLTFYVHWQGNRTKFLLSCTSKTQNYLVVGLLCICHYPALQHWHTTDRKEMLSINNVCIYSVTQNDNPSIEIQQRNTVIFLLFMLWNEQEGTFLYASHTRIISCRSLPSGVVFGTISQKTSSSFLIVWSWRGSTKRMMVIRSPGSFSPFRIIMITFFKASVFNLTSPFSRGGNEVRKADMPQLLYQEYWSSVSEDTNPSEGVKYILSIKFMPSIEA